jgi:uncharacterized SAM-binding protein YcdF (DUF218 family)
VFFVLSKLLGVLLVPSHLMIGIGVVGLILLATGFASRGHKFVIASVLLLAIGGFSPVGNLLLYSLEARFPPWNDRLGAPDGIVVLGGAIEPNASEEHGVPVFGASIDRLIAVADLAHRYPHARILFTGGNSSLVSSTAREADFALPVLESLGISRDQLIIERRARNTWENAEFSKAVASPKPGERWLLLTSAYHMARAVGAFRKAGFAVEPYPVDWRLGGHGGLLRFSISFIGGLSRVDTAIREWIGLTAYWFTGRTSEFFPGPAGSK